MTITNNQDNETQNPGQGQDNPVQELGNTGDGTRQGHGKASGKARNKGSNTQGKASSGGPLSSREKEKKIDRLLRALRAGCDIQQACKIAGIPSSTCYRWKEDDPDLDARFEAAREAARESALAGLRDAGREDWRALAAFLRYGFRRDYSPTMQQTNIKQAVVLCDEETRRQIQEMRLKLLGQEPKSLPRPEVIDAEPEPESES
jgi:hypothetical protein